MGLDELIGEVVAVEKEMFLAVNTEGDCACQDDLESFAFHRKVQFVSWDETTLRLYLAHIRDAWQQGVNLMTIKYARMEDQIPPYSANPLIDTLAGRMVRWQREMHEKYPAIMAKARPVEDDGSEYRSFRRYLSSELETYSDAVLASLNAHQTICEAQGQNLSMVSYAYMVKTLGYDDLDHAEQASK